MCTGSAPQTASRLNFLVQQSALIKIKIIDVSSLQSKTFTMLMCCLCDLKTFWVLLMWVKRMLSKFLEGLLECRFWICCIAASNIFLSRKFARELGRRGLDRAHQAKSIFTFKNLLALEVLWVVVNVFIRRWLDDSFTSYNSQVSFVVPYGAVLSESLMVLLAAQYNLGYWLAD